MRNASVPPVSVVIPTLNESQYLPHLLGSLLRTQAELDVIVVDAGSTDTTLEVTDTFAPLFAHPSSLRVLSPGRGLSLQRNHGARVAKNDIVIFMDADTVITSRFKFRDMVKSFVELDLAVGVPHIHPVENIWRARLVFWLFDMTQRFFLVFNQPYLGTQCLVTTKKVFNAINGFDEKRPVTEDIDYCFRSKSVGRVQHLPVYMQTSARRFIKYGYWHVTWIFIKEGFIWMVTGKARLSSIVYPFGEHA